MENQQKPAMTLAVNWIASNRDPVELPAKEDRLVLHLEALRDLRIRSVRFHFVDGFLGEAGPAARCVVGECGPITAGRAARILGLTRPVARRTLRVREKIAHAPTGVAVSEQFSDGRQFWTWAAGLVADQPIHAPHDFWHAAVKIDVPEGACLGFAVCGLTHPCRVMIQVGGE